MDELCPPHALDEAGSGRSTEPGETRQKGSRPSPEANDLMSPSVQLLPDARARLGSCCFRFGGLKCGMRRTRRFRLKPPELFASGRRGGTGLEEKAERIETLPTASNGCRADLRAAVLARGGWRVTHERVTEDGRGDDPRRHEPYHAPAPRRGQQGTLPTAQVISGSIRSLLRQRERGTSNPCRRKPDEKRGGFLSQDPCRSPATVFWNATPAPRRGTLGRRRRPAERHCSDKPFGPHRPERQHELESRQPESSWSSGTIGQPRALVSRAHYLRSPEASHISMNGSVEPKGWNDQPGLVV